MAKRLVIHFPNSIIAIESDSDNKISMLADFCRSELAAYNASENYEELTVDEFSPEMDNKLHSLLLELEIF